MVLVFPPTDEDPKWRVIPRFWIPKDQVEKRVAEGAKVDDYIDQGAMETTDGDYVDQNAVADAIFAAMTDYDVQLIGYDSWNAAKLISDLQKDGIPAEKFVEIRQGVRSMGEPSKHFERLVYAAFSITAATLSCAGWPATRSSTSTATSISCPPRIARKRRSTGSSPPSWPWVSPAKANPKKQSRRSYCYDLLPR